MHARVWDIRRAVVAAISIVALIAGGFLIQRVVQGRPENATVNASLSDPAAPPSGMSATEAPVASASPSPSPSSRPSSRPAQPVPAGFPSPKNTGWKHTGVTLTPIAKEYIASTPGEVLDAKDFRGGLRIRADNVTVKRSRVQCGNCGVWIDWNVRGTLIQDVEITSKSRTERIDRAITAGRTYDLTIRRVYIHDTQRGIEYGYSALIEDSYVDDEYNPTDAHVSAIGGAVQDKDLKLVVRHNWIAGKPGQNNSAALLYYYETEDTRKIDLLIEKNILNGGSYALWLTANQRLSGSITVRDNLFGTKYFGLCGQYNSHYTDEIHKSPAIDLTWEGNAWHSPGNAKHGKEVTYEIHY